MHNEKVCYRESNIPQTVLLCQFLLDRQPLSFPDLNHRYPQTHEWKSLHNRNI